MHRRRGGRNCWRRNRSAEEVQWGRGAEEVLKRCRRGAEVQKFIGSVGQRCRGGAGVQRCWCKCRGAEMQRCRDAEMQRFRGHADVQQCRGSEMQMSMQRCRY